MPDVNVELAKLREKQARATARFEQVENDTREADAAAAATQAVQTFEAEHLSELVADLEAYGRGVAEQLDGAATSAIAMFATFPDGNCTAADQILVETIDAMGLGTENDFMITLN